MAVVVSYDKKGNPITRSLSGVGISDNERQKAYELDGLLKARLKKLTDRLTLSKMMPKTGSKNKVEAYWELGSVLRKIFFESGLIAPIEKPLYWLNVKLHAPKELLAKDRGPNRIHVEYCFRLAGYPKEIALKREWSEWVYLFDSPSINKEPRFDRWDEVKIKNEPEYNNRVTIRVFSQCLNAILKNIETSDLTDEELSRCYEGAWLFSTKLLKNFSEKNNKIFRTSVTKKIIEKRNYVGELIEGALTANQFADKMAGEIAVVRINNS